MHAGSFTADITAIRERARQKMGQGPVTDFYGKTLRCWQAGRISQLGGEPDFDPATIAGRAHTTYETRADADLEGMLRDNLIAERIVITTYQEIIRWLRNDDPTTRRLLEGILADEEEHAEDLAGLLGA